MANVFKSPLLIVLLNWGKIMDIGYEPRDSKGERAGYSAQDTSPQSADSAVINSVKLEVELFFYGDIFDYAIRLLGNTGVVCKNKATFESNFSSHFDEYITKAIKEAKKRGIADDGLAKLVRKLEAVKEIDAQRKRALEEAKKK